MPWIEGEALTPTNLNREFPSVSGVISVDVYGAAGDGVTDDTAAVQAAETARTAGQTLKFSAGKTYLLSASTGATVLRILSSGVVDFTGATIKYGGAGTLAGGGDGGPLGVLNIMASDVAIVGGTLDGNSKARYLIALNGTPISGVRLSCTIQNTSETSGVWPGIVYSVSADVPGGSISLRAKNISGFLRRPSCPIMNNLGTITTHADVTAVIIGGDGTQNNVTGFAHVMSNNGLTGWFHVLSTIGVIGAQAQGLTNTTLTDIGVHDIGCNAIELYGGLLPVPSRVTLSASSTYTPDVAGTGASTGAMTHFLTITADSVVTIGNPTSIPSADRAENIQFVVLNSIGGSLTTGVGFGTTFKSSGSVQPANGKRIAVGFVFDQVNAVWIESSRGTAV